MFNKRYLTTKKIWISFLSFIAVVGTVKLFHVIKMDFPEKSDVMDLVRGASKHLIAKNKVVKANLLPSNTSPKEILIFGDISVIESWFELSVMVKCFRGSNGVKQCPVFCPKYNSSINLSLGSKTSDYKNKNAIVFGLSPFTLLRNHGEVTNIKNPKFPPNVLTVFYSMECPYRIHKWIWRIPDGKYHVTMTYLTGSNITVPYAYYKPFEKEKVPNKRNFADGKTKLIAWMGSNCVKEVFWPRMEFIHRLQSHVPVDTYGKCGNLTCLPRLSKKCVNMLQQYKFYLAFENSECHEYLTEKFWASSLQNDVVPIVYGASREDFKKFAPENSYIHVGDFKNVKELASYIKLLDENDHLYNKYFDWKTKGTVVNVYPQMEPSYFCEVIPFLDRNLERKPLKDSIWYNSCRSKIKHKFDPKNIGSFDNWSSW
ncbi:glycoprotein 3-alpha-L-fucosyltransferase A-like [Antedon mediterranea]|uniref:glycoprotein 3-alpha-L-fucosyltransferase A-like n=1 Tax=Antedon mediterranea TaxID=105859 RepID=UPI003AF8F0A1